MRDIRLVVGRTTYDEHPRAFLDQANTNQQPQTGNEKESGV